MDKCKHCGKDMQIGWKRKRTYCSDECRKAYYSTRTIFNCVVCGKKLVGQQRQYCSPECQNKAKSKVQYAKNKEIYKAFKPKGRVRHKPAMSLAEVNAKARAEGLNYGQYVAKYGL